MLGIMPYVSAYVLVELCSLFVPFLKKLRTGSFKDRMKLKRIALLVALPLALWQANSLIDGLTHMDITGGTAFLTLSSPLENLTLLCILVGSFYLLVTLCELITRYGIGHGISIIVLSGICGDITQQTPSYFELFEESGITPFIIASIAGVTIITCAYFLLTSKVSIPCYHKKDTTPVGYFQLNMAPSSREAVPYSLSIVMLPLMVSSFSGTSTDVAAMLQPGSLWYNLLYIISIFIISYLFSRAFLHPQRRVKKMQEWGWHFADCGISIEKFLLKKQYLYTLPWTIFLCLSALLPSILIYSADIPFFIGGYSTVIIVAISMDLTRGVAFYKHDIQQPVKIAEYHDIYDANMIENHVKAAGIPCYLRGYHHRLLSYFLGPHIDMSLIIDEKDAERVRGLVQDYYNGLGLMQPMSS